MPIIYTELFLKVLNLLKRTKTPGGDGTELDGQGRGSGQGMGPG